MLLSFVQLDFPGLLGLPDGRYLAREGDGESSRERVMVVQSAGAPAPPGRLRRLLLFRKPKRKRRTAKPPLVKRLSSTGSKG